MDSIWLYPLILGAGALQAWGPPTNGALRSAVSNPWLASLVSFLPVLTLLFWRAAPGPCLRRRG
jgi:transporter family-2 protein